jgi:hypothetical protein
VAAENPADLTTKSGNLKKMIDLRRDPGQAEISASILQVAHGLHILG